MSRRLLKIVGSRGVYLNADPAIGKAWTTIEPLPKPDNTDPAVRLLAEQAGSKVAGIGGLYGGPNANHDAQRRRKANDILAKAWVRPGPW